MFSLIVKRVIEEKNSTGICLGSDPRIPDVIHFKIMGFHEYNSRVSYEVFCGANPAVFAPLVKPAIMNRFAT